VFEQTATGEKTLYDSESNKQASKQASKQTRKLASKQASKQQKSMLTGIKRVIQESRI
jgi:hypothetical protein